MKRGRVNFIIDGQWGSTGKGKLAGFLATKHEIGAVISNFMPNAGHTFIADDGTKYVSKCIPTAAVNKDAEVYLSPNSVIDVDRMLEEIEMYGCADRLMIHPKAAILGPEHRKTEESDDTTNKISSTRQGCGAAMSAKIMRKCRTANSEPRIKQWVRDWTPNSQMLLDYGRTILFESAQGFDLSLNWGLNYPYCTSRDVTIGSLVSDAGINIWRIGDIYGSIRVHPIRVGNVVDSEGNVTGWSGPHYSDHKEMTWEEITKSCGAPKEIVEKTTVTNKVRRVFSFSTMQIQRFLHHCGPTKLFVNFIEYLDWVDHGMKNYATLSQKAKVFLVTLNGMCAPHNCKITHVGTGAKNDEMILLGED